MAKLKKFKTICMYSNSDRISEKLLTWIENNGFEILDTKLDSQYMQSGFNHGGQIGAMTVIYEDHDKPIVFDYDQHNNAVCKKCNTRIGRKENGGEKDFKDHICSMMGNRVKCSDCGINFLNNDPTKKRTQCVSCWADIMASM